MTTGTHRHQLDRLPLEVALACVGGVNRAVASGDVRLVRQRVQDWHRLCVAALAPGPSQRAMLEWLAAAETRVARRGSPTRATGWLRGSLRKLLQHR